MAAYRHHVLWGSLTDTPHQGFSGTSVLLHSLGTSFPSLTLARVPGFPFLSLGSWLRPALMSPAPMSPAPAELGNSTQCPGGVCPICWVVLSSWTLELPSALENALSFFLDLSFTLSTLQEFLIVGPWRAWIEAPVFSPLLLSTCISCSAF